MTDTSEAFTHILCLVDGSEAGCRAAERSARLARSLDAKLTFLAVGTTRLRDEAFEQYARVEGVSDPLPPAFEKDTLECLNVAVKIAADVGVRVAGRLEDTGDVVAAICRGAQAHTADLVVLRRRTGGLPEKLFGTSVSDRFAKECNFAVLSVR